MTVELRQLAVKFYQAGLSQITPGVLLRQALQLEGDALVLDFLDGPARVPLTRGGRVIVVAVGKAAVPMATEARRVLGGRVSEGPAGGIVVTKRGFAGEEAAGLPWPVHQAGHPVPDAAGTAAAEAVAALADGAKSGDVVLALISGGASALLPAPPPGIGLADKQALAELMLRSGMDIHQINTVRKAVSRLKGGGLAALAAPARVVGLLLSDVPGDDPASIGSGPTVPGAVDFQAVRALLREQGLWDRTPAPVRAWLEKGKAPPKSPPLSPVNGLIGANRHLLRAIGAAAEAAGFTVLIDETPITGLNATAVEGLLNRWRTLRADTDPAVGPLCRVSGGETTVEVTGGGKGGRCQELAALMMPRLEPGAVFLAAGSDGNDGPTDAAGGVVDAESWRRVRDGEIAYEALLADHDSYRLLERSGNLLKVAPTGNNVMDVHLFLRNG